MGSGGIERIQGVFILCTNVLNTVILCELLALWVFVEDDLLRPHQISVQYL